MLAETAAQLAGEWIINNNDRLANIMLERRDQGRTRLARDNSLQDQDFVYFVQNQLAYFAYSMTSNDPKLYEQYIDWLRSMLTSHGLPAKVIISSSQTNMGEILAMELPGEAYHAMQAYLARALARLDLESAPPEPFVKLSDPLGPMALALLSSLQHADRKGATALIMDAIKDGLALRDIYLRVITPVMREIGRLWQYSELTVAQEHYATTVVQSILSQMLIKVRPGPPTGRKLVVACVGHELHELGARMIGDLFEHAGWDAFFLGANTPQSAIINSVEQHQPTVLALSATIVVHVCQLHDVMKAIRDKRGRTIPIIVGGHPFNYFPGLWRRLDADGYAPDAGGALDLANRLAEELPPK